MKWGLFGGTFDPVHTGHLRCAEEIRELFALDRIMFIPASRPPHKDGEAITPFFHRERMIRLAISGARLRAFLQPRNATPAWPNFSAMPGRNFSAMS